MKIEKLFESEKDEKQHPQVNRISIFDTVRGNEQQQQQKNWSQKMSTITKYDK